MAPEEPQGPPEQQPIDTFDVTEPFLPTRNPPSPSPLSSSTPKQVRIRLYISHGLSTWNSRMFEFGAVLFLNSIFKGTLLYASVYALVRSLAAVVLASWLGSVADRMGRLRAVRQSIVWQRIPVAASCVCFGFLSGMRTSSSTIGSLDYTLFTGVVLLACVEKLAATANMAAVEMDWAIVISDNLEMPRQKLNSSMRQIDLFCKLFAPVFISLLDGLSTRIAVWVVFGLNVVSVFVEYGAIAQVYRAVPELARSRQISPNSHEEDSNNNDKDRVTMMNWIKQSITPWREYVSHPVFLASFALSLLYLTVLSFGTAMVTYLLHTGFTPIQVSGIRIGAITAELSGTWTAPLVMDRVGPLRSGLWFLNWQSACLAVAAAGFVFLDPESWLVAVVLIVSVSLSRIGLWGFDLCIQYLVQENIEEHTRARFSSTEMALHNVFELLSFATTLIFPLPGQFKYPVLVSYGAVVVAAVCFAAYVRRERGHLLHLSQCFGEKVLSTEYSLR